MKSRPKYVAVVNFSCASQHFAVGDPVDNPVVLAAVLPHGDAFVTTDTARARTRASQTEAEPPASGTTTTSPTEAPK